jgi:hypothetical protein
VSSIQFEVITPVTMNMTLHILMEVYWRFGGTYSLHPQVRRVRSVSQANKAVLIVSCWFFLLGLLVDFENGGSRFLRNVNMLLPHYTGSYPRR